MFLVCAAIIALGFITDDTLALQCFECNSHLDSHCPADSPGNPKAHQKECDESVGVLNGTVSQSPDDSMSYFCVKQTIFISDWQMYKSDGVQTYKKMYEPRRVYYCARLPAETSEECTTVRNSPGVSMSNCICTQNLCNKSPPSATLNTLQTCQLIMCLITSFVALFILQNNP